MRSGRLRRISRGAASARNLQTVRARKVYETCGIRLPRIGNVDGRYMPDFALHAIAIGIDQHVTAPIKIYILHVRGRRAQCACGRYGLRRVRNGARRADRRRDELDAHHALAGDRVVAARIPRVEGEVVAPAGVNVPGQHDCIVDVVVRRGGGTAAAAMVHSRPIDRD